MHRIEEYERHMEDMASTVIQLTDKVGLIVAAPMPHELSPHRFAEIGHKAMQQAVKKKMQYIIIDFSNITVLRSPHNVQSVGALVDSFRLIGIEVLITGITPLIAKSVVEQGLNFSHIRTFATVSNALKQIYAD